MWVPSPAVSISNVYPLDFPNMRGKKVSNKRLFNHNEFVLITIFSNPQKTREIKVLDVKTLRKIETLHISIRADGERKVSIVGNDKMIDKPRCE